MPLFLKGVFQMYEESAVDIRMTKMIRDDGCFDAKIYECDTITYDEDRECIFLILKNTDLPFISLDGIYECNIATREGILTCSGMVTERFIDKRGKILVFQIENGFYKNNLN